MILLLEFLVEVVDRETKQSLHEFRRYAKIDENGSLIRVKIYKQHEFIDGDDCGLAFSARQSVLSQLCARDSQSSNNPMKAVRAAIDKFPWSLDSVMIGRTEFETKQAYLDYLLQNPEIEESLL